MEVSGFSELSLGLKQSSEHEPGNIKNQAGVTTYQAGVTRGSWSTQQSAHSHPNLKYEGTTNLKCALDWEPPQKS